MERSTVTDIQFDIVSTVKNIAIRMKQYDALLQVVNHPRQQLSLNGQHVNPWNPLTLSHGIPGVCMLYAELNAHFPEEGWDQLGHQYLSILVNEITEQGIQSSSMFSGAAGIGLTAICLSQNFQYYHKFIERIDDYLCTHVPLMITECQQRDAFISDYDVIEGLSGIANYLLLHPEEERIQQLQINVIDYLIQLSKDKEVKGIKVPGWYIPSAHQFTAQESELYPDGNFNLGLSHGISGPLLLLSKAWKQGIKREGQDQAIRKMADFLLQFASEEDHHLFWKGFISWKEFESGHASTEESFRRDAWCYGNPGIGLALWYAGTALEEPLYSDLAITNLKETVQDIHSIFSPTFCHGYAGILQILQTIDKQSSVPHFEAEISLLKNMITVFYDKQYLLGFHNYEHFQNSGLVPVDYVGLLDGATGVCLTLLGLELKKATPWDQAFSL
ncbi:lanthionine synthetase C family protein [Paenibacillus sp. PK4536]|uniref:lanthionine synthetase C family protein n=1 Tax=Paenibacillus sp. PK4536 TaxID=3024576 RepID=UPI00235A1FF2|nr:lanthionine synthetase C family protein [Paenibacillus sp. PK4536]WIM40591.1 lanthionine synthetase C family protein [Paenibacillus sp. PK4536]